MLTMRIFSRAMEYINKHPDKKLTLRSLSKIAFMSELTFVRKFKKITGFTLMTYVPDKRTKLAEKVIAENAGSKTEIVHACVFYDVSHMSKYLKKESEP